MLCGQQLHIVTHVQIVTQTRLLDILVNLVYCIDSEDIQSLTHITLQTNKTADY